MAQYLRLRQTCLVAPRREPVISDIAAIMGLEVCYRDGNVEKYGLANALLPVDTVLLEVVAPFREGTAAGRFLDKTAGRGGYMAIFACEDPDARGKLANEMGVRTANIITHVPYRGVQLHPRDCRAAFIEFNHTEDVLSPNTRPLSAGGARLAEFHPEGHDAGADRRRDAEPRSARSGRAPGAIIGVAGPGSGEGVHESETAELQLPFHQGDTEIMSGLDFRVGNVAAVCDAARGRGA